MDETDRDPTGEPQPQRDDDEEPQAFTPVAPFGDAKPWAGSTLDPEREGGAAADQRERAEERD